ncbi:MAG: hypothetical protein ABJK25_11125 [Halieaceae bacterium]
MLRSIFSMEKLCKGLWVSLISLTFLVACDESATTDEPPNPDMSRLEQRVEQRWQARIIRDWETTWEYTTPNYRRIFPKRLYINKFSYAVDWELTGVEVVTYDARAAVASVAVRVMSSPTKQTSAASRSIGTVPVTFTERWLYVDGEWWYSANE